MQKVTLFCQEVNKQSYSYACITSVIQPVKEDNTWELMLGYKRHAHVSAEFRYSTHLLST